MSFENQLLDWNAHESNREMVQISPPLQPSLDGYGAQIIKCDTLWWPALSKGSAPRGTWSNMSEWGNISSLKILYIKDVPVLMNNTVMYSIYFLGNTTMWRGQCFAYCRTGIDLRGRSMCSIKIFLRMFNVIIMILYFSGWLGCFALIHKQVGLLERCAALLHWTKRNRLISAPEPACFNKEKTITGHAGVPLLHLM